MDVKQLREAVKSNKAKFCCFYSNFFLENAKHLNFPVTLSVRTEMIYCPFNFSNKEKLKNLAQPLKNAVWIF